MNKNQWIYDCAKEKKYACVDPKKEKREIHVRTKPKFEEEKSR